MMGLLTHGASAADIADLVAHALIEIGAVHVRPTEPFTYTSGLKSPVYVDCRKVIAYPRARTLAMDAAVQTIVREFGAEAFDAVVGGETAGIPFAAWIAERLSLPMHYVRKKPKGFGRDSQVEGDLKRGQTVILVEDLATDGGSKVAFADALRAAGANVSAVLVIFHHDIFPGSVDALADHGLSLRALCRWSDVLAVASRDDLIDRADLAEVEGFLADPYAWSTARGGIAGPAAG